MTTIDVLPLDVLLSALDDGRLIHLERLPARDAVTRPLARPLAPDVEDRLPSVLWSHQAAAIDLARQGTSVAVSTGTASGKSLCFQAPIADAVADPLRPGTALIVYPTKALAQDQLRALTNLGFPKLVAGTYDGDSTADDRVWVRRHANVVLTNPEMLHCAVLPHHARWATFLMRLRYVVIDELHVFRGIFGTHVAHLLRRLRRVCTLYGADPTFVFTSATIGSPARLASALCGLPVDEVTDDGSPRGERLVALWNPPVLSEDARARRSGRVRASAHGETAGLVAELVRTGHRAIAFCRSRRGTEVVASDIRRRLPPDQANRVRPYRGGYLPTERRAIEAELFGGALQAVVATTALELGVDIGGLEACVLDGFPGTIASLWQQAGRAGREQQQSLAVLVGGDDQLDQWFMAHPRELFTRPPEPAVINPANPFVLHPHLACAAFEMPLTHADEDYWPGLLDDGVRDLVRDDRLRIRRRVRGRNGPVAVWGGRGFPAHGVGLRSGASEEFTIVDDDGDAVGTVDGSRAFEQVHPGAIYLHQGQAYRVTSLDLDERVARVEQATGDEYTLARTDTTFRVIDVDHVRAVGRAWLALGAVEVISRVTGYQRRDSFNGEILGAEPLDLPPSRLTTRAFWYTVDAAVLAAAGLEADRWPGTLHAVEHAGIGILPLFTICDRWDVGGVSTLHQRDTGLPTIVIYDGYAGGAGIAELGFEAADRHLAATLDIVTSCPCADGCPSCVQSPKCGNWNEPLDKDGARRLVEVVLGRY